LYVKAGLEDAKAELLSAVYTDAQYVNGVPRISNSQQHFMA